jgi:hypothetical protein
MAEPKYRFDDSQRQPDERRDKESRDSELPDERRESGDPGGGQGRRDETGRSGVYPVSSGEFPEGEAPLRTEEEWGQGERGARGYLDHGSSGEEAMWEEEKENLEGDKQEKDSQGAKKENK